MRLESGARDVVKQEREKEALQKENGRTESRKSGCGPCDADQIALVTAGH